MLKVNLLNEILKTLNLNEFRTLVFRGCFDIVAKKDETVLIKVLFNVDGFSKNEANELKILSHFLQAKSICVSFRNNRSLLSNNIIYSRFGLPIVSLKSFELIIESGEAPKLFAIKGKHVERINTKLLREKRKEWNLSLEDLGAELNLSKKSLYEIETGRVLPTKETVDRIENFFGMTFSEVCEIKQPTSFEEIKPESTLEKKVCIKFSEFGMKNTCFKRAPFDVMGKKRNIFVTLIDEESKLQEKSIPFKRLASFMGTSPIFFSQNIESTNIHGIPVISGNEIDNIQNFREFKDLIDERKL